MNKTLTLIILALILVACDSDQGPEDLAQAQATAASEADRGQAPAVVFQRAAESAASLQEWRIYADGRAAILDPSQEGDINVREAQVGDQAVEMLLQDLQTAGFYEAAEAGEQRWNENLRYVISTQRDGAWHSLALEGVTPETSPLRLQSLTVVEKFIFEEIGN